MGGHDPGTEGASVNNAELALLVGCWLLAVLLVYGVLFAVERILDWRDKR